MPTAAEKYRQLIEEANKLKETAAAELRTSIQRNIDELNTLGFSYRLAEGPQLTGRAKKSREKDPSTPCSVCKFVTSPPHDGRVHRSQGDRKKPFTAAELVEKGFVKL
jgi:hypothetical protein